MSKSISCLGVVFLCVAAAASSESFAQSFFYPPQLVYYGQPIPVAPAIPIGPPVILQQSALATPLGTAYQSMRPLVSNGWQSGTSIQIVPAQTYWSETLGTHPQTVTARRPIYQTPAFDPASISQFPQSANGYNPYGSPRLPQIQSSRVPSNLQRDVKKIEVTVETIHAELLLLKSQIVGNE